MNLESKIHQTLSLAPGVPSTISDKHYIGEVGTVITVDCGRDVSSATVYKLYVRKPDGTIVTWQPVIVPVNGVTHSLVYTTVLGDFDQAGTYSLQSYVVTPAWTGRGDAIMFYVSNYFDVDATTL